MTNYYYDYLVIIKIFNIIYYYLYNIIIIVHFFNFISFNFYLFCRQFAKETDFLNFRFRLERFLIFLFLQLRWIFLFFLGLNFRDYNYFSSDKYFLNIVKYCFDKKNKWKKKRKKKFLSKKEWKKNRLSFFLSHAYTDNTFLVFHDSNEWHSLDFRENYDHSFFFFFLISCLLKTDFEWIWGKKKKKLKII